MMDTESSQPPSVPKHRDLLLPLLDVLEENGPLRARDAAEAVADKLALSPEVRGLTKKFGDGQETNVFQRRVRWVRQTALVDSLILNERRGVWELGERGHKALTFARPGVVVCVARTNLGAVLWGEAMSALQWVDDGSVQLLLTSSPYPLVRNRDYDNGAWGPARFMDTMLTHCDAMKQKLTANGSMVLNLGNCYNPGSPTLNTYQEELVIALRNMGYWLCGKQTWFNPGKPKTTSYVTKTRERLGLGTEVYFWFSPSQHPKASNLNVLEPYSERHLRTIAAGGQRFNGLSGSRQGHPGLRYRTDNGGRIPFDFIQCGSEGPSGPYGRYCKARGLPLHPARMPARPANFWIRFTTDPGDVVADPFGGSLQVAAQAEALGRHFFTSDYTLEYLRGGTSRFHDAPGYEEHFDSIWMTPGIVAA
jgi:site-specific DNA-methyltransferase (cytosine-N4-specific)